MDGKFYTWLINTLISDPLYSVNIICNYYDDCSVCPLHANCPHSWNYIESDTEKYYEEYLGATSSAHSVQLCLNFLLSLVIQVAKTHNIYSELILRELYDMLENPTDLK